MEYKNIRLLYVEDEEALLNTMMGLLDRKVKELYVARDGEEGLEAFNKYKPDVMLVDVNIPKLNGLELVEQIRQKDQNVKVIMLTAYSDKQFLMKAMELKLTKYLIKPVIVSELQEALELAIQEIGNINIEYKKLVNLKDDFVWNIESGILTKSNEMVKLTPKESKVLDVLIKKQNSVVSYDDIIYTAWEDSFSYSIDNLKTTIKSLRRKLPENVIENVYGVGYKIVF